MYAKLANLPSEIRNGNGIGGGRVVGWLPVVRIGHLHLWCGITSKLCQIKDSNEGSGKANYVDFKRIVWHECFRKLLKSIAEHSEKGCWIHCADGIDRRLFPCILIISADYEEQYVVMSISTTLHSFALQGLLWQESVASRMIGRVQSVWSNPVI